MRSALLIVLVSAIACSKMDGPQEPKVVFENISEAKGLVTSRDKLTPPRVVHLDTMPARRLISNPPIVTPAGRHYAMRSYTANDGLPVNGISYMLLDKKGNIWFATGGGGVSRYDGKSFTSYSTAQGLVATSVGSMLEDRSGNLWFGTDTGVSKYDGRSFTTYAEGQGLANNVVNSIIEDTAGNIWLGTGKGVSKYDGKSFTTLAEAQGLANNNVTSTIQDKAGNLWFGTDKGVSKYDGKSFTTYAEAQGLAANKVTSIIQDKVGNLWFGTDKGASKYDGKTFTTYNKIDGLADDAVTSIVEDRAGNLWFGTAGRGVSQYDGKSFTNFGKAEGLADNHVTSILEDRFGNLWFGTDSHGVSRYDGIINYTEAQGLLGMPVTGLLEDKKGNFWFATINDGVSRYDGKSFTRYTTAQGLVGNNVRSMFQDKAGNLWFGTEGSGVSKFDGKSFTNFTKAHGLGDNTIEIIYEDKAGNIWFGTVYGGLTQFDGKSFTSFTIAQGLVSNYIYGIFEDKAGNLWFGTLGGGVSKYDGTSFTNYDVSQGVASNSVSHMVEDKAGNFWLGTDTGIRRYDGKSFIGYSEVHGLSNNTIEQMIVTQEGNLAFGTNAGLNILTGFTQGDNVANNPIKIPVQNNLSNEKLKNYTPVFEVYNEKRGFPIGKVKGGQSALYLDTSGMLWYGNVSNELGLTRFNYGMIHKIASPPNVFVQSVKIDNEYVGWYDLMSNGSFVESRTTKEGVLSPPSFTEEMLNFGRMLTNKERVANRQKYNDVIFESIAYWYPVPQNLTLPHDHNNITFEFVAIEPGKPEGMLYQYKLEGYDRDWIPPTSNTFATFGHVFEGTYEFKVRAKSIYGGWSEPTIYTFSILPPWYRTWWAYTLYGIIMLTLLFLIYRWRTSVLRARQRALEILYRSAERFLPKDFLRFLKKEHFQDVNLGDSSEVDVGIMFSDIRGFTSLTEKLGPQRTAIILNKYMGYMAPIIRQHNGVVGQFLGDGILAFFETKPEPAIDAIFEMQKMLPDFNKDLQEFGCGPVEIGVGLNVGHAVFSIIGEKERLEGHVISDDVNLAARVESLNKLYKTSFLITGAVYDGIANPNQYLIRLIDKVIVQGKTQGVRIYQVHPLPNEDEALSVAREYLAEFSNAFAAYEKGDFLKAQETFKLCLGKQSDDTAAKILLYRCEEFLRIGSPKDWDGTFKLSEK
jgi:ligand-binding sensor domain-containing protein/class 3 adenylate cyclase